MVFMLFVVLLAVTSCHNITYLLIIFYIINQNKIHQINAMKKSTMLRVKVLYQSFYLLTCTSLSSLVAIKNNYFNISVMLSGAHQVEPGCDKAVMGVFQFQFLLSSSSNQSLLYCESVCVDSLVTSVSGPALRNTEACL